MNYSSATLTLIDGTVKPRRTSVTLSKSGGRLGRQDDCDWVLPEPGVSRTHGTISWQEGQFFITDVSQNGILRNGEPVAPGVPVCLADGDTLGIGDYIIGVSLSQSIEQFAAPEPPSFAQPVPPLPPAMPPAGPVPTSQPAPLPPSPPASDQDGAVLFPPSGLDGAQPASDWDWAPVNPDASAIPASDIPPPEEDVHRGIPPPPPPLPAVGASLPVPPDVTCPDSPDPLAATLNDNADAALLAFCRGAGVQLEEGDVDAVALFERLGRLFAISADGLHALLEVRRQIRRTFRLGVTEMRPADNNPLNLSPEVARAKLFKDSDPSYTKSESAYVGAFDSLQAHELAMLAGMKSALMHFLDEFHPDNLETRFARRSGGGRRLPGIGPDNWQQYRAEYEERVTEAKDKFDAVFGPGFEDGYLDQMRRFSDRPKDSQ